MSAAVPARPAGLRPLRFADRTAMGIAAARDIAAALRAGLAGGRRLRVMFAAAPSQQETLAALVGEAGIDWARIEAFHMDEYIGLPEKAPQRFALWLEAHLFGKVPFGAVHAIKPERFASPADCAADYAGRLAAAPLDIVCLGIGVNGHLAFNDPPVADFNDPLADKIVELDDICRRQQVDDGCFPAVDAVPQSAITVTIPALMAAGQMFCMVPGLAKRAAVAATLAGPISTACPASILRTHPDCRLYLDADSAGAAA